MREKSGQSREGTELHCTQLLGSGAEKQLRK